jgi:hypothetical protein
MIENPPHETIILFDGGYWYYRGLLCLPDMDWAVFGFVPFGNEEVYLSRFSLHLPYYYPIWLVLFGGFVFVALVRDKIVRYHELAWCLLLLVPLTLGHIIQLYGIFELIGQQKAFLAATPFADEYSIIDRNIYRDITNGFGLSIFRAVNMEILITCMTVYLFIMSYRPIKMVLGSTEIEMPDDKGFPG